MTSTSETTSPLLVLGDDGSSSADLAWRWVTNQQWPGWAVESMTADDTNIKWGATSEAEEWSPPWARTEEVRGASSVRFLTVATDARAMLADRGEADLMVVGLRTHSYLEAMIAGSTTEWLLHHPPAPLVVVQNPETVRSVTVCVDGSIHATAALNAFASLPLAGTTRTTVLAISDGRTDAEGSARDGAEALEGRVAEVSTAVLEGKPTESILDHLNEHRPEMVVLGTRGLTGWRRLRLGSTATSVARAAPYTSLVASDETQLT